MNYYGYNSSSTSDYNSNTIYTGNQTYYTDNGYYYRLEENNNENDPQYNWIIKFTEPKKDEFIEEDEFKV